MIRGMAVSRSVVSSAKLIAICTLVSRVTGLARDILLAQVFGLGWVQDAFSYAFQVPNLFRRLFGEGAMAPVFVPAFVRTLENEGRESAWRLLARTLALLTLSLCVIIVVIGAIIALVWFVVPMDAAEAPKRKLLLVLTATMLPFMLTICIIALLSAILNCVGSFVPAAFASVVLNLCMIAGIVAAGPLVSRGLGHTGERYDGPAPGGGTLSVISGRDGALSVARTDSQGATTTAVFKDMAELERADANAGAALTARRDQVLAAKAEVIAISVVVAGLAQLVFIYPALRKNGVPLGWRVELRDPTVRRMLRLLVPVALGQGVLAFGVFLDAQVCWMLSGVQGTTSWLGPGFHYPLDEGALSTITYAQRLYQFPLGVLVISLATAALPAFSRLAAREDWPAWTAEVRQDLRLAIFEGVLAGTMMIMLAVPIVRLLFERGKFTPDDTLRAGYVLVFYGLGLWAFCAQIIVLRAFYSTGDVRTPLIVSAVLLPLNVVINVVLVWVPSIREAAFAIGSCTTSGLAVIVGVAILQRRTRQRILDRTFATGLVKMLVAAGVTGALLAWSQPAWVWIAEPLRVRLLARAVTAVGPLMLGIAVFLAVAWALRLGEVRLLLPQLRRRRTVAGA